MTKNGVYHLNDAKTPNNKTNIFQQPQLPSPSQNIKRLRSKSKTFPVLSNIINNNNNEQIDAIISLNSTNRNQVLLNSTTKKPSRSRSRASSLTESYTHIPSPAELLRKYSSIKGHICEMDKLFKGSSLTLTQCLECENLRKCPEAFYDRSLPVNTIKNGLCLNYSYCTFN